MVVVNRPVVVEMVDFTPRKFLEGDLVNWWTTEFYLNSSMGTARRLDIVRTALI